MQLTDVFYCAILVITVAVTCVEAESIKQDLKERNLDKRVNRREAIMLIDNFPMETISYQKPKVIYRRISTQKYRAPKPKPRYGPPRPKYGPPKSSRKPGKKYRGKSGSPKYGPPSYKKRSAKPKPRYGRPKRPNKPVYGPPKQISHYTYFPPEPVGFGEPPSDFANNFQSSNHNYGEPPVDSYGAPIKTTLSDILPTLQNFQDSAPFDSNHFVKLDQEYQSWKSLQQDQKIDNKYAYSKKHPNFVEPEPEIFVTPAAPDYLEDSLNSYSDIYSHRESIKDQDSLQGKKKKKKKTNIEDNSKVVNKPWKTKKKPDLDEEIIIGGQYAEPPARYMPKFPRSADMYSYDDDEFSSPLSYLDSDVAASATNSPYVNYKNSNMAFNPQNLNDAFSVMEK